MKATSEIRDAIRRPARTAAAERRVALGQPVTEALRESSQPVGLRGKAVERIIRQTAPSSQGNSMTEPAH